MIARLQPLQLLKSLYSLRPLARINVVDSLLIQRSQLSAPLFYDP
jgi:hypothetical protein